MKNSSSVIRKEEIITIVITIIWANY